MYLTVLNLDYNGIVEVEQHKSYKSACNYMSNRIKHIENEGHGILDFKIHRIAQTYTKLPFISKHLKDRAGIYTIEQVHTLFEKWKPYWDEYYFNPSKIKKKIELVDGYPVKVYSQRYELFYKNIKCVKCGLEANCYILEKAPNAKRWHFNLYYKDEQQEILFTKDHIFPKSKGGSDCMENYQTMCETCNIQKSDTLSMDQIIEMSK